MKNLAILTIIIFLTQCEPVPTQSNSSSKTIVFDNFDYELFVGMAQIMVTDNNTILDLENPIITFSSGYSLLLQFDLLTDKFEALSAKIYHCNKNWEQSSLRDMEFMNEINTYRIADFDYSINTKQPYIQYRFTLPTPKISGNYIVSVHRRANPKDLILTRKFCFVDNTSEINQLVRSSTTVAKRATNQQIDFSLNYGNVQVNSPTQDISLVLLQNHCWQDAISNIKPSLIRPNENYMEFQSIDLDRNFNGWNEFRFFDLRTLNVTGRNVGKIMTGGTENQVLLGTCGSRGGQVYTQNLRDINGNFILENADAGEVPLNSDYANVYFFLKSERVPGDVYVRGRFNNWALSEENQMIYDESQELYKTAIYLKQGYYDFQFALANSEKPPFYFEGSHYQTENEYEILVYYRRPGNINDELIGYKKFNSFINQ